MTTDPPTDFEDVRIEDWETSLPSAICTNKEIFDEIFSWETWKTVLKPEQRDRVLKMLPPEVLKTPGAADKAIEDLFSKSLTTFGSNPLDTVFDNLLNGHYDPEVVETKACIVKEWRRESRRLMKHYHTKLLQDIVISREQHLRKLVPVNPSHKRNGKKPATSPTSVLQNNSSGKKNGKADPGKTNGVPASKPKKNSSGAKSEKGSKTANKVSNRNGKPVPPPPVEPPSKGKRGRVEAGLSSPPNSSKDGLSPADGPAKKKAKQSQSTTKSKATASSKKAKDSFSPSEISSPPSSQPANPTLLLGNSGTSFGTSGQQSTSLLLGTLTAGSSPLEPPTLSLRSPTSSQSSLLGSTSILESLISPSNSAPPVLSIKSEPSSKQLPKLFPSPALSSSSSSQSFLQSPVQSSPILASQLQAPSPISVNLSTLTGAGLGSSRNDSITDSPSSSSITLNYTQTPPPTTPTPQSHMKSLIGDNSSSDEFEFESIEPTIGFSGPSTFSSKTSANIKTLTSSSASAAVSALATPDYKKASVSTQELQSIQKCSLLTNCLTQPLPANSSAAAVSAALANNILTSTPVPVSTAIMAIEGGNCSPTVHHRHHQVVQQPQGQLGQHKIIVTSGGPPNQQQQQLSKFFSLPAQHTTAQKLVTPQQLSNVFQQQRSNVICAAATTANSSHTHVDAQTLVSSLISSSKDLLATFGASISSVDASSLSQLHSQQQHSTSNVLPVPIAVNIQSGSQSATIVQNQQQLQQLKQEFIRVPTSHQTTALIQTTPSSVIQQTQLHQQQMLSSSLTNESIMLTGEGLTGSPLNTQSLRLPSSILSSNPNNGSSLGKTTSLSIPSISASTSPSITNLLDSDDLGLNLGSFSLGGMSLDMGVSLPELDTSGIGGVVGSVDQLTKLELDCGMDKIDDLSGVLDGNPFDSIPNLSDDLDGLDLDMVDGLCDFESLLSEEKQYASFFSLIREVLCSTRDHRMTLVCLEKTIRKWSISPGASLNPWFMRAQDWNIALIIALNFLAGNYNDVHPEDFVPYIEYKYKTKYYQWIGAGRDGDNNLTPLCNLWMNNLDRLPPLKKSEADGEEPEEEEDENEDSDSVGPGEVADAKKKNKRPQTPPPPRCTTDWTVRSSTPQEKEEFRAQEKCRFDNPHKAFTYRMHGYESVVGPVKGVYSSQTGVTNKARGHSLLVDDRPPFVTILALVRDAVARLPNGEGTRSEICEMLRDSAFLAPDASGVTLNSVVSGALDRLHYERDPCVRYDSHKKSWIYLHRDRTQEQFERLHHNRSYLKSTKSRSSSSRKNRKGKSSSSSSSASTPVTPAPTAVITVNSSSQSSTSSQSSSIETIVKPPSVSTTITTGGVISTNSEGSLVTLPPVSTISSKVQVSVTPASVATTTPTVLQHQAPKPTVGLISVPASPTNIQLQQQTIAGNNLQQQQPQTVAVSSQGLTSFTTNHPVSLQDTAMLQQNQPSQASLNEILAAAATGLRIPSAIGGQGASIVLNQNVLGVQQTKVQQQTFVQDATAGGVAGQTTRLVLQQSQIASQNMQQQQTVLLQQQQNASSTGTSSIAPGQILLSPSSAILKLAGNIRLAEGLNSLKFTQLRLPTAGAPAGGAPLTANATNPLRLPPPRILLTRGALPGQSHTQGVFLGQTSTGQTVILSAGPSGAGAAHAVLQQALSNGSNSGLAPGNTAQLAIHSPYPQAQTQIDSVISSSAPSSTQASVVHQSAPSQPQQQSQQVQQKVQSQQIVCSQSIPTFATNKVPLKFGIIANVPNNSNALVVSSAAASISSPASSVRTSFSTSGMSSVGPATTSTLPPTSIALPASILAPAQSQTLPITPSTTGSLSSSNPVSASTTQCHQQIIFTTKNGGGGVANVQQSPAQIPQQISSVQGTTTAVSMGVGNSGNLQLQGLTQQASAMQQLKQPQQGFILQQQQNSPQIQGLSIGHGQGQHQLTAPIIIRSAQGEFVSFGIPSNLSLGRGMQGLKVIPVQGNKAVFARVVGPTPGPGGKGNLAQATTTSSLLIAGGNLPPVSAPSTVVVSSSSGGVVCVPSVPSSLSLPSSAVSSPQVITLHSGSPNAQFTQQSPVITQSQASQQLCAITTSMGDTNSSNGNASGGLGTVTLSTTAATPSSPSVNSTANVTTHSQSPSIVGFVSTPSSSASN